MATAGLLSHKDASIGKPIPLTLESGSWEGRYYLDDVHQLEGAVAEIRPDVSLKPA